MGLGSNIAKDFDALADWNMVLSRRFVHKEIVLVVVTTQTKSTFKSLGTRSVFVGEAFDGTSNGALVWSGWHGRAGGEFVENGNQTDYADASQNKKGFFAHGYCLDLVIWGSVVVYHPVDAKFISE